MITTAIIAEVLIIGMEASIWLLFLALALFGYEWLPMVKNFLNGWESLALIYVIGFCYVLGILVDRVADVIFDFIRPQTLLGKIKRVKRLSDYSHSQDSHIKALAREGRAHLFLEYINIRIRITRSSALNFFLITVFSLLFVVKKLTSTDGSIQWNIVIFILVVGVALTILSALVKSVLEITFKERVSQAYNIFPEEKSEVISENTSKK